MAPCCCTTQQRGCKWVVTLERINRLGEVTCSGLSVTVSTGREKADTGLSTETLCRTHFPTANNLPLLLLRSVSSCVDSTSCARSPCSKHSIGIGAVSGFGGLVLWFPFSLLVFLLFVLPLFPFLAAMVVGRGRGAVWARGSGVLKHLLQLLDPRHRKGRRRRGEGMSTKYRENTADAHSDAWFWQASEVSLGSVLCPRTSMFGLWTTAYLWSIFPVPTCRCVEGCQDTPG